MTLDHALLKSLPKVLLHEHLDGVLRPETVIDLARSERYTGLPTQNPEALAPGSTREPTKAASPNISKALSTPSPSCKPKTPSNASPTSKPKISPPTASSILKRDSLLSFTPKKD